jgi:SAM-dependent methyltransferase
MIQEEHFDEVAEVYDESLPAHVTEHYLAKRTSFLLEASPPPARLLDVGCGTGALAARLAARGYEVTGLDPSEGMLRILGERAPEVTAVRASATEMPFDDGGFDVSVSVATMHHIADPDSVRRALGEMVRVVRPGGTVVVWDHNPRNPYWPHLMKRVPQDRGDERLVGLDELVNGLSGAGADSVTVRQLGMVPDFVPARLLRAAAAAERAAERTPGLRRVLAHNVVVAVRR